MTPLYFHLLPDASTADLTWAIGATAPGGWLKVCKPEQVQPAQAAGLKVYLRPYLGGDDNGVDSGKSWAETVIGAIQAAGNHWPDALCYRNEMSCTQANVTEYGNYRTRLQQAGYGGLVVLGSFGVGNPDWPQYGLLASASPDAIDLHEYWDLTIAGSSRYWVLRHLEAQLRGLLSLTTPIFIGECGSDGITTYNAAGLQVPVEDSLGRHGWQDGQKLSAAQESANSALYSAACSPNVVAAFVFADGGTDPKWLNYHTRGTPVQDAIHTTEIGAPFVTPGDSLTLWARDVLVGLGATVNASSVAMLLAWGKAEGGIGHNNPLNTTLVLPNSTPWNYNGGYPVQAYPDLSTGVTATLDTILAAPYAAIVRDLQSGNIDSFPADVYASPWGTRQGIDVAAQLAALGATAPPSPSTGSTGPEAPDHQKGHAGMPAPLFQFDQGPGTFDCWVRCIESFFLRYGYTHDVDAIFQAGYGYVRPAGGQAAPFSVVKQAITALAAQDGVKLQLIDLDNPGQVSAALSDPDTANPWTIIAGVAEQVLQPGQTYGHYIILQQRVGDTVTVVDSNQREDGNQSGTYTWEQVVSAMAANWDPVVDAIAAKLIA